MVLDQHRQDVDTIVVKMAMPFMRFTPNTITGMSVVLTVVAALVMIAADSIHAGLLVLASILIFVASALDAVDGKVARLTGTESKLGDFVDHVSDRYNDLMLIAALALTPYASSSMVIFALTGVFMVSYMGTQAQAVGCSRDYGGLLGRADRLVMLIVVLPVQYALIATGHETLGSFTVFDSTWEPSLIEWMLLVFAVAGHITALQRFRRSWRSLASDLKEQNEQKEQNERKERNEQNENIEQDQKQMVDQKQVRDTEPEE